MISSSDPQSSSTIPASSSTLPCSPTLTPEQIKFYVDNGYLVIPQFFPRTTTTTVTATNSSEDTNNYNMNNDSTGIKNANSIETSRSNGSSSNNSNNSTCNSGSNNRESVVEEEASASAGGGEGCLQEIIDEMNRLTSMYADHGQGKDKVLAIIQPQDVSPVIQRYLTHPKIANILKDIVGAHLAHWDHGVKAYQSMLFQKPPNFPGQAWHQDELYIPTRDRSLTAVWIPLEDTDVENGCLWVVPGSHQHGIVYRLRPHNNPNEYEYEEESYGFDESKAIPVEMKAGDALFFNGYLLHRSLKNRSKNRWRRVITNHYMSSSTLFPMFVDAGPASISSSPVHHSKRLMVAAADYRAITPVYGVDPYAYKGYIRERRTHFRVLDEDGLHVVKKPFPHQHHHKTKR